MTVCFQHCLSFCIELSIYFLPCVLHTEEALVTGCFSLQPFYTSKHFYCNTDQQRRHPWCHGTDKLEDILFFLLGISPTTVPDPSPALYTIYLMPHSQHSLPGRRVRAGPLSLSGDGRVRRTHHYYGNERRAHQPHATSPANDQGFATPVRPTLNVFSSAREETHSAPHLRRFLASSVACTFLFSFSVELS